MLYSIMADFISISGFIRFLNMSYELDIPPNQHTFCVVAMGLVNVSTISSTYFLLFMTFERFYSIIRPHKAASVNTVKRAKVSIVCIVMYSIIIFSPFLFTSSVKGRISLPQAKLMQTVPGLVFYWFSTSLNTIVPFMLFLIMNSIIIHVICNRSKLEIKRSQCSVKGQGHSKGQSRTIRSTDRQITFILLLVTFSYLILLAPGIAMMLVITYVDMTRTPKLQAGFHLLYSIANKGFYTNLGINFYLYVFSGHKFRNDVVQLLRRCLRFRGKGHPVEAFSIDTQTSTVY